MANNAVLEYLNLICETKHSTKHHFFADKKSFDAPHGVATLAGRRIPVSSDIRMQRASFSIDEGDFVNSSPIDLASISPTIEQVLPIHDILKDIYQADLEGNVAYFEPLLLHYWQLQRLLEMVRCNTKLLALPANLRTNLSKIEQLRAEITRDTHPDTRRAKERAISDLERSNLRIQEEINLEKTALKNGERLQDQENIQAVLVLATLLNVIYRKCMSTPMLCDQFRLEAQQHECKALLNTCGIEFDLTDEAFSELFSEHHAVVTVKTIPNRILSELKDDWSWLLGRDRGSRLDRNLASARYYVSRVLGAQGFHAFYNHFRLGFTRSRRLLGFLDPFIQNATYSAAFKTVDPYFRYVLGYLNWMFFLPRLSLNFSILGHHLLNDSKLEPLERKFSLWVRFRAHWTRFWFEFINDIYWILNGLKLCFWLPGGALSPQGIFLSFTVQSLDLFCSIVRAGIELSRLHKMASDLEKLQPNNALIADANKRFWFEALFLGYMVFHFSVLVLCLWLTLPSVASVSLAWPVVGSACAVLLTVMTFYMQAYFARRREAEFECRPRQLDTSPTLRRLPSTDVAPAVPNNRFSRYFA